jgi:hypothetical protein
MIFLMTIINVDYGQEMGLRGTVIDKETNKPLMFSIVEIKALKIGTYSDSIGNFTITYKSINDTVEFYSLGYKSKKYQIADFNKLTNKAIKLEPNYINLKEVVVVPHKYKTIKLGTTTKKPWRLQVANIFGGQYGIYIKNTFKETGYVKNVSFYITKVGYPNTPFRIRIYSKDQLKECPGKDLLNENVIVSNPNGEGWFTVDISKYSVPFPADGIFVTMEWIYSGDQYYYTYEHVLKTKDGKPSKKTYHVYGLSLGNAWKQSDGFWAKGLGDNWNKMNDYYKGYVNVMINSDISFQTKK